MSELAVTIVMAGGALLALALLATSVRRARAAEDLDASTALTLAMGWLISLPIAVVVIGGDLTRRPDVFGELVPVLPGWYPDAVRGAMVLVAALAAGLLLKRARSGRVLVHTAGLIAVVLWLTADLASRLQGGRLLSLGGAVMLVCLMAATVLPRGRGACLGAGVFGVTLAVASGILAALRHDLAFVDPCEDACEGLGFTGVLPNPDLLGVVLAVSIPFVYLGFRGRERYWLVMYLSGMVVATGSRTATVAALIAMGALFVIRPDVEGGRRPAGRAAIAGLLLAATLLVSAYVSLHDWDPDALTDRPVLWNVASEYVHESPLLGYGPDKWASLYESSEIPRAAQRSAHNQFLDVLFTAGWVGAALFAAMIVAMLWTAREARRAVMVTLAALVMIGTTEGVWAIGRMDFLSFSLVALILIGPARETAAAGSMARASAKPAHDRPPAHLSLEPGRLNGGRGVEVFQ